MSTTTPLRCLLLLPALTIAAVAGAQDSGLAALLDEQRQAFPQEKIHVMTDRDRYLAGDTVWLRIWTVDATSHRAFDASAFAYVELRDPHDGLVQRVKVRRDGNGVLAGYLPLDAEMAEGDYQLAAYTTYMRNVDEEYAFRKTIAVRAVASLRYELVTQATRRDSATIDLDVRLQGAADHAQCRFTELRYTTNGTQWHTWRGDKTEAQFVLRGDDAQAATVLVACDSYSKYVPIASTEGRQVRFYAEGGYLVPDVECLVAFEATAGNGAAVEAEGDIVDDTGTAVCHLATEHDGLGAFTLTPRPGARYYARCSDGGTYELPAARAEATVVQVRHQGDSVTVSAVGRHSATATLVVQQRGVLVAAGSGRVTLARSDLADGVAQAMAFDGKWRCLSERLFFVDARHTLHPAITPDRDHYDSRSKVTLAIDLPPEAATTADCALVVTDARVAHPASPTEVMAELLLQSELRGRIADPCYYFEADNAAERESRSRQLDVLMLTHGWRRYDIPALLRGYVERPTVPAEDTQALSGTVLSEWRGKPLGKASVCLLAPKTAFTGLAITDDAGRFTIPIAQLPYGTECLVVAYSESGKPQMNVSLDHDVFPTIPYAGTALAVSSTAEQQNDDEDVEQAIRLAHTGDWRHVLLNEIVVKGYSPRRRIEVDPNVVDATMISERGVTSLEGVLALIPGATGKPFFVAGMDMPEFDDRVIDDLDITNKTGQHFLDLYPQYHSDPLNDAMGMLPVGDIEQVVYVPGRGGGYSIIIPKEQSRRGDKPNHYLKRITPLGYQPPAEFYSPRYAAAGQEGDSDDLREVLYWSPSVTLDGKGHAVVEFYASDATSTTYSVALQGVADNGRPVMATGRVSKR